MNFADIQGFAIDLDGVIADTAKFHGQAWHQIADQVGTKWTEELADSLRGVSRMDSLDLILKAGGHENDYSQEQKEKLAEEKNNNYLELVKTLTPNDILPGIKDFLNELKAKNYHIVLASASKNGPTIIQYLELEDYFEGRVDPAKLKKGKPDPEIYLQAAEIMNLAPEHVAGIEDAQSGIESINRAGEISIGIGAKLQDADVKFNYTSELNLTSLAEKLN